MLKRRMMTALGQLLGERGFVREKQRTFMMPLAMDVFAWLSFGVTTRHQPKGVIGVWPVIGVRFQRIEQIIAECGGQPVHRCFPSTYCTPMGYVILDRPAPAGI